MNNQPSNLDLDGLPLDEGDEDFDVEDQELVGMGDNEFEDNNELPSKTSNGVNKKNAIAVKSKGTLHPRKELLVLKSQEGQVQEETATINQE